MGILLISLITVHVIATLSLIFLILLHSGKGGGLSDLFGGGAAGGSMAGSTIVEKNLDRITIAAATVFIFTTIILSIKLK
jgi:preprotein translocase subunit SecG